MLRKWDELPYNLKNESVRKYYEILHKKRLSLFVKRIFDIIVSLIMIIVLAPLFIIITVIIKIDSKGPVMFRQVRVTQYGKRFRIYKFRTMVSDAEKIGAYITIKNDSRVTRVGKFLRKYRLDECPQLFNIIAGDMSFVGTRPEVVKYIEEYTDEMMATLLLPAGVTSEACIQYKDEELILSGVDDVDKTYIDLVLPGKMILNLRSIDNFSLIGELKIMVRTVLAMVSKDKGDVVTEEEKNIHEVAR